jgi:hypothetical protein
LIRMMVDADLERLRTRALATAPTL